MTPDQYCEQKIASGDSGLQYGLLFLEPEARRAVNALYAFCREVNEVVDECRDPGVARAKLAWWREEIGRAFTGTPQHPVTRALKDVIVRHRLPQERFQEIIAGTEMDLDCNAYRSFAELSLYCHRASAVGLLAAEVFGYEDRRTLDYAHHLGMAIQLTRILRDITEDARRGRVYLPEEDLARFGVSREDVLSGRFDDRMHALLEFEAGRAGQFYLQADERLPERDRYRQRGGLIMAAVHQALLKAISNAGFQVFTQRIELSPPRKLFIAWQAARREKRRRLSPPA
jgi:phytoene synthase